MADHEQSLREILGKIAKKYNYKDTKFKIEPISSGGSNYTSILYNMTISSSNYEELQLFAKVLNFSKSARDAFGDLDFEFDAEHLVYRDLANKFKSLEQKHGVPDEERYKFPKFYYYNSKEYEETVVLENLLAKGYEVYDRLKSIDWPYACKAIEALAKFHALNMVYQEEKPEEYQNKSIEYTKKIELGVSIMSDGFKNFVDTALSVTREENKERLQRFCDREISLGNVFGRYFKPQIKPTLIHGDFRQSNLLHKLNEDGTIDIIPVDYQTIQTSSCVIDLLYFIFSGSDAQFRASYYQRLVDHFYDSLRAALTRLSQDPDKIYPRKDFDQELRETLPYGLILAIFVLPVVTVAPEDAPDLSNEDMMEKLAKPKTSSQYIDRINGVIDDFVKWGIL